MSELLFIPAWKSTGERVAHIRDSSAFLTMRLGQVAITRNEDIWSRTVSDSVLVSTYPLAMWLATCWWRLNHEPMQSANPAVDWRMAHEMGAANQGYVWPQVLFATDNEQMQVRVSASKPKTEQSVRYLSEAFVSLPLQAFQQAVTDFIETVILRLNAMACPGTELESLWNLVKEDRADVQQARLRTLEAALGYDPEECPEELLQEALRFGRAAGDATLTELAPLCGKLGGAKPFDFLRDLSLGPGMEGKPCWRDLSMAPKSSPLAPPWSRAVDLAQTLRQKLGLGEAKITNEVLHGLLGLQKAAAIPGGYSKGAAGLGIPQSSGKMKFIARKQHPLAKRFELSRFIADLVYSGKESAWLASTDLFTARQKFQRAFAAEFLCPIQALTQFLGGDFSESGMEAAAEHFEVSERTVEALLTNQD